MKNYTENSIVNQRYKRDCGVASLAMYTGRSYNDIQSIIVSKIRGKKAPIDGMSNSDVAIVLRECGVDPMITYTLIHGLKAIICVPSVSMNMGFHLVYWDGYNIYDPDIDRGYNTKIFLEKFPVVECIISKNVEIVAELPSHFKNEFDWDYIESKLMK